MRCVSLFLLCISVGLCSVAQEPVQFRNDVMQFTLKPNEGGAIADLRILGTDHNLAGDAGMLLEGFGSGSFYVPNRRLNERLTQTTGPDGPVYTYTYDCDGENIRGFHVTRTVRPLKRGSAVRVSWRIDHKGQADQWVVPWVRHAWMPGGVRDDGDRVELPTLSGVRAVTRDTYYPVARNWAAATDPATQETIFVVTDANNTHSVLAEVEDRARPMTAQTAYVPFRLEPGQSWETAYTVGVARGLNRVDFATDELAAKVEYEPGELTLMIAPVLPMSNVEIEAVVVAPNDRVWRLPGKKFNLTPGAVVRCTYDWAAPADAAYDFIARLRVGGEYYELGRFTKAPHGAIDAQFVVGSSGDVSLAPWTDAPHALDRRPRTLQRNLAVSGDVPIWFESPMTKLGRHDRVAPGGRVNPVQRVALARNEAESFQLALAPPAGTPLRQVHVSASRLTHSSTGARLPADAVDIKRVRYLNVPVPSYFEGPTGQWPDPLEPIAGPFDVEGGTCQPIWFTVRAPADAAPGVYSGIIELSSPDLPPIEILIEAEVFDFMLPERAHLMTDFGFDLDVAMGQAKQAGYKGNETALASAYRDLAADGRVTLRGLSQLPAESPDYGAALAAFKRELDQGLQDHATTFHVPVSLVEFPEQLAQANAFVKAQGLADRAFVHFAHQPMRHAWNRYFEEFQKWRDAAPDIPVLFTTIGMDPLLHDSIDIWGLHTPLFDTAVRPALVARLEERRRTWVYVSHEPPRPYANLFVDFSALEHRVLFWQCYALGIEGLYYWNAQADLHGRNPFDDLVDVTPVNGDGYLLYPGAAGPMSSIRWSTIRDGIEDHDYLSLYAELARQLDGAKHPALTKRVTAAYNLDGITTGLAQHTDNPEALSAKRRELAELIVEMKQALR